MLWICTSCTAAYAPEAPRCPQCGGTDWVEQGSEDHLAFLAIAREEATDDDD